MGEISRVPGDWLVPKKTSLGILLCTAQGIIFLPSITYSSQLSTKSWGGLLRNDGEKDN